MKHDDPMRWKWLPLSVVLRRGSVMLYDSCIIHRGRRNALNVTRYMAYHTFQRPGSAGLGWVDELLGVHGSMTPLYYHTTRAQMAFRAIRAATRGNELLLEEPDGDGAIFVETNPATRRVDGRHCPRLDAGDALIGAYTAALADPEWLLHDTVIAFHRAGKGLPPLLAITTAATALCTVLIGHVLAEMLLRNA